MSVYVYILITAAAAGFLAGLILRKVCVRRLPQVVSRAARQFAKTAIDPKMITAGLSGAVNFDHIRPLIEEHVDEFLGHKLGKEMPMIGMFIGDKTIAQLKGIFMKELAEIFPLVMNRYVSELSENFEMNILFENISGAASATVNDLDRNLLSFIPLYTALTALAIGFVQVLVVFLLS